MLIWLLRARAWQMFLLLVVLPLILQAMSLFLTTSDVDTEAIALSTGWQLHWQQLMWTLVLAMLTYGLPLAWMWAIMQRARQVGERPAPSRWLALVVAVPLVNVVLPPFVFPLHLLATGCLFYYSYCTVRDLRMAELQRPVALSDYLGEFVLLWFFPVGVWVVQPRLNALAARLPAA